MDIKDLIVNLAQKKRTLFNEVGNTLTKKKKSVQDVFQTLKEVPGVDISLLKRVPGIATAKTIDELIDKLYPLSLLMDNTVLDHLIKRTQTHMDSIYLIRLHILTSETTIGEVATHWPDDENDHQHFSWISTVIYSNPNSYTLENLEDFCTTFCSVNGLPKPIINLSELQINSKTSFCAKWSVPNVFVPELTEVNQRKHEEFYTEKHVVMVKLNDKVVYESKFHVHCVYMYTCTYGTNFVECIKILASFCIGLN